MTSYPYLFAIAPGYGASLGSLINIMSITAPGDNQKFYAPQVFGFSRLGARAGRLTGIGYRRGYKSGRWHFPVATFYQYEYARDTILLGLLSGPVTIFTRLGALAYTRCNAVMDLPAPDEQPGGDFYAFKNGLDWTMTRVIALL